MKISLSLMTLKMIKETMMITMVVRHFAVTLGAMLESLKHMTWMMDTTLANLVPIDRLTMQLASPFLAKFASKY